MSTGSNAVSPSAAPTRTQDEIRRFADQLTYDTRSKLPLVSIPQSIKQAGDFFDPVVHWAEPIEKITRSKKKAERDYCCLVGDSAIYILHKEKSGGKDINKVSRCLHIREINNIDIDHDKWINVFSDKSVKANLFDLRFRPLNADQSVIDKFENVVTTLYRSHLPNRRELQIGRNTSTNLQTLRLMPLPHDEQVIYPLTQRDALAKYILHLEDNKKHWQAQASSNQRPVSHQRSTQTEVTVKLNYWESWPAVVPASQRAAVLTGKDDDETGALRSRLAQVESILRIREQEVLVLQQRVRDTTSSDISDLKPNDQIYIRTLEQQLQIRTQEVDALKTRCEQIPVLTTLASDLQMQMQRLMNEQLLPATNPQQWKEIQKALSEERAANRLLQDDRKRLQDQIAELQSKVLLASSQSASPVQVSDEAESLRVQLKRLQDQLQAERDHLKQQQTMHAQQQASHEARLAEVQKMQEAQQSQMFVLLQQQQQAVEAISSTAALSRSGSPIVFQTRDAEIDSLKAALAEKEKQLVHTRRLLHEAFKRQLEELGSIRKQFRHYDDQIVQYVEKCVGLVSGYAHMLSSLPPENK